MLQPVLQMHMHIAVLKDSVQKVAKDVIAKGNTGQWVRPAHTVSTTAAVVVAAVVVAAARVIAAAGAAQLMAVSAAAYKPHAFIPTKTLSAHECMCLVCHHLKSALCCLHCLHRLTSIAAGPVAGHRTTAKWAAKPTCKHCMWTAPAQTTRNPPPPRCLSLRTFFGPTPNPHTSHIAPNLPCQLPRGAPSGSSSRCLGSLGLGVTA